MSFLYKEKWMNWIGLDVPEKSFINRIQNIGLGKLVVLCQIDRRPMASRKYFTFDRQELKISRCHIYTNLEPRNECLDRNSMWRLKSEPGHSSQRNLYERLFKEFP